jgi:CDP-diacylglycerol--glycerol-3-phosphate 3-phosphatidyltransferase
MTLERSEYLRRWSGLHGGYEPQRNALVRCWLGVAYAAARPLAAARVRPGTVSAAAVLAALGATGLAALGGRWALAAAPVVVLAGLLDNLDGAVAILTDRASRSGMVLDSFCDRVSDALFVTALWLVGAPAVLCLVGGVLMFLQEYVRAQAAVAGLTEVGVVTVWERPTRVLVTAMFLLAAGVFPGALWPLLGAAAWVALGVAGLLELAACVRRRLA